MKKKQVLKIIFRSAAILIIFFSLSYFFPYGKVMTNMVLNSLKVEDDYNTNARAKFSYKVLEDAFYNLNIFGNGFGEEYKFTMKELGLSKKTYKEEVYYGLHHNSVLSILYYLGWVPFFLFILFLINTIRMTIYYRNSNHNLDELILFSSASFGMIPFIFGNVALETQYYSFYFWLYYGGTYAAIHKLKQLQLNSN